MATGLGKSLVATQLIANEINRNKSQEILVLAHMTELVKQLELVSWSQLRKNGRHIYGPMENSQHILEELSLPLGNQLLVQLSEHH